MYVILRRALPVVAVALLAVACIPDWATVAVLTPDGAGYDVSGTPTAAAFAAQTGGGGNEREALFVTGSARATDEKVCATWVDGIDTPAQPGLMLRWDGTRGVTLTKNVIYGNIDPVFYTTMNVHTWDTSIADPGARYTQVAQFPFMTGLRTVNDRPVPGPWRACASVTGPTFTFKVWPLSRPEPSATDPCCTGTATVPVRAGQAGWYAGHLPAGSSIHFADMVSTP